MSQSFRDLVKSRAPGWWLLTNRPWQEMQDSVNSAAILTHTVNKDGFFIGYPNLHPSVLLLAESIPSNAKKQPATSRNIEELANEFMDRLSQPELIYFAPKFTSSILSYSRWKAHGLATVLNHNLQVFKRPVQYENLPKPRDLSLEMLYGLVLSYYPESRSNAQLRSLVVTVPLLTAARVSEQGNQQPKKSHIKDTPPSLRKTVRIRDKMILSQEWMNKMDGLVMDAKKFITGNDPIALRLFLEDIIEKSRNDPRPQDKLFVGSRMRRHLRSICRQLERMICETDEMWEAQRDVLSLSGERNDYRSSGDLNMSLLKGLEQALARLPTDIQVSNMSVLRDMKKHFLYNFLESNTNNRSINAEDELMADLVFLANLSVRLRSFGIYKSDWKNAVATYWNRKVRGKSSIYGPAHYDLALDLFPWAHAFAYTRNRASGYALGWAYEESLSWLCEEANMADKVYFMDLMRQENHSDLSPVSCLNSLPTDVRSAARNSSNYKSGIAIFIKRLDFWLTSNEAAKSACAAVCRDHVQAAIDKLPERLRERVPSTDPRENGDKDSARDQYDDDEPYLKQVSAVALFSYVMENYDGPAALAATIHQKAPVVLV